MNVYEEQTSFGQNLPDPVLAKDKLRRARKRKLPVYMYGSIGFGKSRTALRACQGLEYLIFECGRDSTLPSAESLEKADVLIIENLQCLSDHKLQRAIASLIGKDLWIIFISRAPMPAWLSPRLSLRPFVLIDQKDLSLGYEQICMLMRERHLDLPDEIIRLLLFEGEGNLSIALWGMEWFAKGCTTVAALADKIKEQLVAQIETQLFAEWPQDILPFLAVLSLTDVFTLEMAESIDDTEKASALIEKARNAGNFLKEDERGFSLRPVVRMALERYGQNQLGSLRMKDAAYRIGLYYEQKNDLPAAIAMYRKSGRKERIRDILVANSSSNVSSGFYYQLRHEYLMLDETEVGDSLELMSALAVLYDLLLRPEQSEYWRKKIERIAKEADGKRRKEAIRQSLYLDICLMHTGSRSLLMTLNKAGRLMLGGLSLPEFSVTSLQPSLMNGGKDFSHWSAHDRAIAFSSGAFVSRLLGQYGAGLVPLGLAESLYEKGGDPIEVLHLISRAEMEILNGGKLEMSFVAVALRVRLLIDAGQPKEALSVLQRFRKKLQSAGASQMMANLDALVCRIGLLCGDEPAVDGWYGLQEDFGEEFYSLHRYQYLTLIRVWIEKGQLFQALSLLDKLEYYCEFAGRTMHAIEVGLYKAIVLKAMEKEWLSVLSDALASACRLGFYPLVCNQSPRLCEMLIEQQTVLGKNADLDAEWLDRVTAGCKRFLSFYPCADREEKPVLSRNGLRVLSLQAKGLSAREIADVLHLKIDNVRYHIKENYRRLRVNSKAEALLYAREIGLI